MLLEGLTKTKNMARPKAQTMDLGIRVVMTWEYTWKNCMKPIVKSLMSKRSCKCLKTIFKRSLIKRCGD
jgi:hypothetical protein